MSNLAVIFPGVGYHSDKPLLYYSKKILKNAEYDIREVVYDFGDILGFIKEDPEKTKEAIVTALKQVSDQLSDVKFDAYERVLFVGKSIGTTIAAVYAKNNGIDAEHLVFTPIPQTFEYLPDVDGFVFHGDADPLCDTQFLVDICETMSLTYVVVPGANHSLETGDVREDIQTMEKVMTIVEKWVAE